MKNKFCIVLFSLLLIHNEALFCQENVTKYPLLKADLDVNTNKLCYWFGFSLDLSDSLKRASALTYINDSSNMYSYTMMIELKEHHNETYKTIKDSVKIMQYYTYLQNCHCADRWSFLTLREQTDSKTAKSIILLGKNALPYLGMFLNDTRRTTYCSGTEGTTLTNGYILRIKDFAYRYAAIILEEKPIFLRKSKERDVVINAFIKKHPQYFK